MALTVVLALGVFLLTASHQARGSGPRWLLPTLVADPPDNVSIETSVDEGGLSKTEVEPKLLLRFNGYVHNDGKGPLDIRGEREPPAVSVAAEQEVEEAREHNQKLENHEIEGELIELPQKVEEELASPPMHVTQQLFETDAGAPQTNPERQLGEGEAEYKERFAKFGKENEEYLARLSVSEELSTAEMFYVKADGHHHWHLQHVAKYSLWNASKTAEVAPAAKVGFCLEDSEHVEETDVAGVTGPKYPVYADSSPPYRDFCQQFRPNATLVYEGISPGWRDRYTSNLGFQWVDISNVQPGEYWLREEVNPEHEILEEGTGTKVAYATEPTIVPGFDALPQAVSTSDGEPVTIPLASEAWNDEDSPTYSIVSGPRHGVLEPVNGTDQIIYRPSSGYAGQDSFTFSASDPSSEFPRQPEVATITINVGTVSTPSVAISGAPAEMIAGTSVQLSAQVANDSPGVMWSASAGSINPSGLYTAPSVPPPGSVVVVTARSSKGAQAQASIAIKPVPKSASGMIAAPVRCKPSPHAPLCRPEARLVGRELIMTTRVGRPGRVRLSAYLGRHILGSCAAKTVADRSFSCRIKLSKRISRRARISVLATLAVGHRTLRSLRSAAPVPEAKDDAPPKRKPHEAAFSQSLLTAIRPGEMCPWNCRRLLVGAPLIE